MNCIFSIYLPYFVQKTTVWEFHPPHVIDTCTLLLWSSSIPEKKMPFPFHSVNRSFYIFPSCFSSSPSSHIFGMQLNWGFHKSSFTLCSQEWKGIMHLTDRDDNGCFMHILKNKLIVAFSFVPVFYFIRFTNFATSY